MSHSEIQRLENQFPLMSRQAFAAARKQVLESGQSVLQSEGGFIYRVFPDGSREVLKQIDLLFKWTVQRFIFSGRDGDSKIAHVCWAKWFREKRA